jgi:hypothetical protein
MIREGRYQKIRYNADIDITIYSQADTPTTAHCANFN